MPTAFIAPMGEASMTVRKETEFVSGLPVWKKMSDTRKQANGSLVGESATEGSENAAVGPARGATCSGLVNFAPTDDLGSRQLAGKTAKATGGRKTNTGTN